MAEILPQLVALCLIDMLNPSAIAVTGYILLTDQRHYQRSVLTYVAGIFTAYLAAGVTLTLALDAVSAALESPTAYAIQGILGAGLFGYALIAPGGRKGQRGPSMPRSFTPAALFALGVTITLAELITAAPYLGAITLITRAELPVAVWLPILVAYNVGFVLPPMALMLIFRLAGSRGQRLIERFGAWVSRHAAEGIAWVLGIIGFALMADALAYFDFFGLIESQDLRPGE